MKFPHFRQLDTLDCGPTCLRIICRYYGVILSEQESRTLCYSSRVGVSILNISDAAEKIGFHSRGLLLSAEQLIREMSLPCVLQWNQNHFVVLYKIKKRKGEWYFYISDPAEGLLKYSEKLFLRYWAVQSNDEAKGRGIALQLTPLPKLLEYKKLSPTGKNCHSIKTLLYYLLPQKNSLIQVVLAMIVASILSLILPFITQSIVDRGIALNSIGFVKTMLVAQLLIVLGQLANDLIRNWLMLHITARLSISLISDFLSKLMRLPIAFFDSKMTGDIMQRIQDHNRIQEFLTNSLLNIAMASILLLVYGGILGGYNLKILLIFLIGTILYITWVLLFLKYRRKLDYMRFQEAANNQSNIVQLIGGMQDIKLNNSEKKKRWEWERIQVKLFRISIKSLSLSQVQEIGGVFIDQTKNIIISFLAAKSVIDGNMTLGMMTALTYIIGQLNAPVSQFISFVRESQDANISLERLGEIHDREDEEPVGKEKLHDIPEFAGIEFKNVTFKYGGPRSPIVLDNLSFMVPYGKVTAIVGASGSGKTTLMKMMLGFYSPISGNVTLGGIELKNYSESSWRRLCGCVMQEGYIFSSSIAENIALCDEVPDLARVRAAADVANIRDWIESLPLGFLTTIGAEGHGVSVGQKQRILIARAAYKNSPYLFFDEATNSLDANNEKTIMENLDKLFKNKTVVIIAHRLSTVKNADNIIVLNQGQIVEEGTHLQLIAKKGYYFELVRNQLELGK